MSQKGISIRWATEADVQLILQLIRDLAVYEKAPEQAVATDADLRRHLFGDSFRAKEREDRGAGERKRGPVAECLIGEVDGVAQGIALFYTNFSTWTGKTGLYLEDLFVRPAARGKGLGRALLLRLAGIAAERGCARVEWMVIDWNAPAIEFYKALGARALDQWTVYRLDGDALANAAAAAKETAE